MAHTFAFILGADEDVEARKLLPLSALLAIFSLRSSLMTNEFDPPGLEYSSDFAAANVWAIAATRSRTASLHVLYALTSVSIDGVLTSIVHTSPQWRNVWRNN